MRSSYYSNTKVIDDSSRTTFAHRLLQRWKIPCYAENIDQIEQEFNHILLLPVLQVYNKWVRSAACVQFLHGPLTQPAFGSSALCTQPLLYREETAPRDCIFSSERARASSAASRRRKHYLKIRPMNTESARGRCAAPLNEQDIYRVAFFVKLLMARGLSV